MYILKKLLLPAIFGLFVTSTPLMAQNYLPSTLSGGQACYPMNLNQALTGLRWRSEGAVNESNKTLWVVCETPTSPLTSYSDILVTVVNTKAVMQTVQCIMKVTDLVDTSTVGSGSVILSLPALTSGFMVWEAVYKLDAMSLTVSCKLPPGTGVTGVMSESF